MQSNIVIEPYVKAGGMGWLREIFSQADILVVATGSLACISGVRQLARQMEVEDRLYSKGLSAKEFALGKNSSFIKELLALALQASQARGIIVYCSCLDILACLDEQEILEATANPHKIPIAFLYRGPLAKRRLSPRIALDMIWKQWGIIAEPVQEKKNTGYTTEPEVDFQKAVLGCSPEENILLITPGGCVNCLESVSGIEKYHIFNTRFNDLFLSTFTAEQITEEIKNYFSPERSLVLLGTAITRTVGIELEAICEELCSAGFKARFIETDGFRKR